MHLSVLIDTNFLEAVAADMRTHFEKCLNREVPVADLAYWLDCLALDAGVRPGENLIDVAFIHPKDAISLEHFSPSSLAGEIHAQAFKDNVGEFMMQSLPVENIVTPAEMLEECIVALQKEKNIDKIVVVAEEGPTQGGYTLCNMQMQESATEHIILGYSLLAAFGISPNEL